MSGLDYAVPSGDWYAHALLHAIIGGCGLDLPKSGAAMAAPAAPLPTPLYYDYPGQTQMLLLNSRLYLDSLQIHFNPFLNKFWTNGWRSAMGNAYTWANCHP